VVRRRRYGQASGGELVTVYDLCMMLLSTSHLRQAFFESVRLVTE